MILSDTAIRAELASWRLQITTRDNIDIDQQIWPASLDFRLGHYFKIYKLHKTLCIDPKQPVSEHEIEVIEIAEGDFFLLHPRDFVLGVTMEKIKIPYNLVARCEWRSSLGRLGLIIHSTAGFIDPGFEGTITLEITNINTVPIKLYPGMRIGQFAFERIEWTVENTYDKRVGSKYMHQVLPEQSRITQDLY
jgi:dCTP deaminase